MGRARHHFFVDPADLAGGEVAFSPEQEHQIGRVLRLRTGNHAVVLDGLGAEREVVLTVDGRRVRGTIVGASTRCSEPVLDLVVYQALIRPEHLTWLLQKGTEVGVSAFVPVQTARSQHGGVPSTAREDRHRAILREAAEQSRRLVIPRLGRVLTLPEAVAEITTCLAMAPGSLGVLLWEGSGVPRLLASLRHKISGACTMHLLVGPAGGWTPEEVDLAGTAGLEILSLGPRLLRAETAALIAATGLLSLSGDIL